MTPITQACPVCLGEGRVYRMTASYEAMATNASGGSFGWTGPTHEWRTCRVCDGKGILAAAPAQPDPALDVERHWIDGYLRGREDDQWRSRPEIGYMADAYAAAYDADKGER